MTTPTVSVIIPTYNRAHLIPKAINSVLNQTFTDYEIIVIDDGSTDDTEQVVAGFGDKVRYIKQENAGSSAARNHGLKLARGEFIAFLDSDDQFLPEKLEKQVAYLRAHPHVGLVHGQYADIDPDGNVTAVYPADALQGDVHRKFLVEGCPLVTPSVMLPRHVIDEIGEFDLSLEMSQDIDYWMRVARKYPFGVITETITYVLIHPGNKARRLERLLNIRIYILDKHFQPGHGSSPIFKHRVYASRYLRTINLWLADDGTKDHLARKYFAKSWVHLMFTARGYTVVLRLLFRTLVPKSLRGRLRGLWRRKPASGKQP